MEGACLLALFLSLLHLHLPEPKWLHLALVVIFTLLQVLPSVALTSLYAVLTLISQIRSLEFLLQMK